MTAVTNLLGMRLLSVAPITQWLGTLALMQSSAMGLCWKSG